MGRAHGGFKGQSTEGGSRVPSGAYFFFRAFSCGEYPQNVGYLPSRGLQRGVPETFQPTIPAGGRYNRIGGWENSNLREEGGPGSSFAKIVQYVVYL